MSEYIAIEPETTADPDVMVFHTNLRLTDGPPEHYAALPALEEGSPMAQALSAIPGLREVRLEGSDLTVRRDPAAEWHHIAADISSALKSFYL